MTQIRAGCTRQLGNVMFVVFIALILLQFLEGTCHWTGGYVADLASVADTVPCWEPTWQPVKELSMEGDDLQHCSLPCSWGSALLFWQHQVWMHWECYMLYTLSWWNQDSTPEGDCWLDMIVIYRWEHIPGTSKRTITCSGNICCALTNIGCSVLRGTCGSWKKLFWSLTIMIGKTYEAKPGQPVRLLQAWQSFWKDDEELWEGTSQLLLNWWRSSLLAPPWEGMKLDMFFAVESAVFKRAVPRYNGGPVRKGALWNNYGQPKLWQDATS